MRRTLQVMAVVVLVALAGAAGWLLRPASMPTSTFSPSVAGLPHIVVVMMCTVRRDQLTPYGGHPHTTPGLASLAEQGARFADGVAAAPWTKAAATALFTGQHAMAVAMTDPGTGRNNRVLPEGVPTLAERLVLHGYRGYGATGNPNLNPEFGLARGFVSYSRAEDKIRHDKRTGVELVDDVLGQLAAAPADDAPRYVQLTLVDAHDPISLPDTAVARFREPGVSEAVATYRAALSELDQAVMHLWEGLPAVGLGHDETIFVLVSDHGEGLGMPEHHGKGHGFQFYPSAVSVPWIVLGPTVQAGSVVRGLASQVDLGATVMGLAGLHDADLGGISHADALTSGGRTTRKRAFTDTWFYASRRSAVWTRRWQCQVDYGSKRPESFVTGCFDRRADPEHAQPVQQPDLFVELDAWRAAQLDAGAMHKGRNASVPQAVSDLLEALGYVE